MWLLVGRGEDFLCFFGCLFAFFCYYVQLLVVFNLLVFQKNVLVLPVWLWCWLFGVKWFGGLVFALVQF